MESIQFIRTAIIVIGIWFFYATNIWAQQNLPATSTQLPKTEQQRSFEQEATLPTKGRLLYSPPQLDSHSPHANKTQAILPETIIFNEDFEKDALAGWQKQGTAQWGTPAVGPKSGYNSNKCLAPSDIAQNYANNADNWAFSPNITLTSTNTNDKFILTLWEWFDLETEYDYGYIKISKDNGATYETLSVKNGTTSNKWQNFQIDLSIFRGQTIKLAFQLDTDEDLNYAGWFIDDVKIIKQEPDPLKATITSLESQLFPDIYLSANVESFGNPLATLTQSNFKVYEDNVLQTQNFSVVPPGTGGGIRLADIVFILDTTSSMGDEIAQVKTNITNFANALKSSGVDYALGLMTFGDGIRSVFFSGTMITNTDQFITSVSSIGVNGGDETPENSFGAIRYAISNYKFRSGSQKIFVLVTDAPSHYPNDGFSEPVNPGPFSQTEVIGFLNDAKISCYALAIPNTQFSGIGSITAETNGKYFDIKSPFNTILTDIAAKVSSTYRITYRTSNAAFDGKLRNVRIEVTNNGITANATGTYTPGTAPKISRTQATKDLSNQGQISNAAIKIEANITDTIAPLVQSATLYYRTLNIANPNAAYKAVAMTKGTGDLYSVTIPSADVKEPGLDYYITATDGNATSSDPANENPQISPYQITILPNQPPRIVHTALSSYSTLNQSITIKATVTDNTNNLTSVRLIYRVIGQLRDETVAMTLGANNEYTGIIPATAVTDKGLRYAIIATDNFGSNTLAGAYEVNYTPITSQGLVLSSPVDFGQVLVFDDKTMTVTVKNNGSATNVGAVLVGANKGLFSIVGYKRLLDVIYTPFIPTTPPLVAQGETITFQLSFKPTTILSSVDAKLQITSGSNAKCFNAGNAEMPCEVILLATSSNRSYGTTVITHGFTPNIGGIGLTFEGSFVPLMAKEIIDRFGGCLYLIQSGNITKKECPNPNGEQVIMFDWVKESDTPTFGYAEGAGDALAALLVKGAQEGKWDLKQVHFIGHSRGTVVLSETIQRLGIFGKNGWTSIPIDNQIHFTTLDAHPTNCKPNNCGEDIADALIPSKDSNVNGGQGIKPVLAWENVGFFDNFFQKKQIGFGSSNWNLLSGLDLKYSLISLNLSSLPSIGHTNIHSWYRGTINHKLTTGIENSWYSSNQRTSIGFNQTKVAGGNMTPLNVISTTSLTSDPTYRRVFNGDFSKGWHDILGAEEIPGWELHGGNGTADLDIGFGNYHLSLKKSSPFLVHNYTLIPPGSRICYRYAGTGGQTKVYLDNTLLHSHDNNALFYRKECTPIVTQGGSKTIKFEASDLGGLIGDVWIDDVNLDITEAVFIWSKMDVSLDALNKTSTTKKVLPEIHVYDSQNRHTGTTATGFESLIPNSKVIISPDSVFVGIQVPESATAYTVKVGSNKQDGKVSYVIEDVTDPVWSAAFEYKDIPVTPTTVITQTYTTSTAAITTPIKIDTNGDGTPEQTKLPTSFVKPYTIKATVGTGGKLSIGEEAIVNHGQNLTVTITPDSGYRVNNIRINGSSIPATNTYTFTNVTTDQTIEVAFIKGSLQNAGALGALDLDMSNGDQKHTVLSSPIKGNGILPIEVRTQKVLNVKGYQVLFTYDTRDFEFDSFNMAGKNGEANILTKNGGRLFSPITTTKVEGTLTTLTIAVVLDGGSQDKMVSGDGLLGVVNLTVKPTFRGQQATPVKIPYIEYVVQDNSLESIPSNAQIVFMAGLVNSEMENTLPETFVLQGNYPNPFNPITTLIFDTSDATMVSVDIFDLLGRKVQFIPAQPFGAGKNQSLNIDGQNLQSGTYIYRLTVQSKSKTTLLQGKMTLLK